MACFLDIENAYNNVSNDVAVKILDDLNVGSKICTYLWAFLSERHLKINLDGKNNIIKRRTNKGLAQGDPLSPLIFNVITHKIYHRLQNVQVSQYADDFVLFVSDKDIKKCERYVQEALNTVVKDLNELGLSLSVAKTNICTFSRGATTSLTYS